MGLFYFELIKIKKWGAKFITPPFNLSDYVKMRAGIMKKGLENSITFKGQQSIKKGCEIKSIAERLAEIFIAQIEFQKNKNKKDYENQR